MFPTACSSCAPPTAYCPLTRSCTQIAATQVSNKSCMIIECHSGVKQQLESLPRKLDPPCTLWRPAMPISQARQANLYKKLRLYLQTIGRAALSKRGKQRNRRWSDSCIIVDPVAWHHTLAPRRPRGRADAKFRVLPRQHFVHQEMERLRRELRETGGVASETDAGSPDNTSAAAVSDTSPGRAVLLGISSQTRPSRCNARHRRDEANAASARRGTLWTKAMARDAIFGDNRCASPAAAQRSSLRGRRLYDSKRKRLRETKARFADSRPLTYPITGFMRRRASMVELLDLGVMHRQKLHREYRTYMCKDLESVRPPTKLIMMLSGLYMPNTISTLTDKKMKETKFMARKRPEFEEFYSDERILQRESNRFSPVVVKCTRQLWGAFTNCLGSFMTETSHGVFFQQLKVKIDNVKGSAAAMNSLRADDPEAMVKNMRDDWNHDSHGNALIDYPHFALAVWEPSEIACGTVEATEVEELFVELVRQLTKTDPKYGKRILAFPFDPRVAHGTPSKALLKLRRVAVLVNLVDGITRFRSPVETPRTNLPTLPPVRGPPPPIPRPVAVVCRGRRYRRLLHKDGLVRDESRSQASCDYLSRLGLLSLAEELASNHAVAVPTAATRLALDTNTLHQLLHRHEHLAQATNEVLHSAAHNLVGQEADRSVLGSRPATSTAPGQRPMVGSQAWGCSPEYRPTTAAAQILMQGAKMSSLESQAVAAAFSVRKPSPQSRGRVSRQQDKSASLQKESAPRLASHKHGATNTVTRPKTAAKTAPRGAARPKFCPASDRRAQSAWTSGRRLASVAGAGHRWCAAADCLNDARPIVAGADTMTNQSGAKGHGLRRASAPTQGGARAGLREFFPAKL